MHEHDGDFVFPGAVLQEAVVHVIHPHDEIAGACLPAASPATTDSRILNPSSASDRRRFSAGNKRMICPPAGMTRTPAACNRLVNRAACVLLGSPARSGMSGASSTPSI